MSSSGQQADLTDLYNCMQDLQVAGNELISDLRHIKKIPTLNGVKQAMMFVAVQISLLDLVISAYSDYHDGHPSVQVPVHSELFIHLTGTQEFIAAARFALKSKRPTHDGLAQSLEDRGATLAKDLQKLKR